MAAAERDVWTAAELRRLLANKAGYDLSAPSVTALLTGEPAQVKLSTLAALCVALDCTPNDLFDVDEGRRVRVVGHEQIARAAGAPGQVHSLRAHRGHQHQAAQAGSPRRPWPLLVTDE